MKKKLNNALRKKVLVFFLTLAMLISLMPAVTLPASAELAPGGLTLGTPTLDEDGKYYYEDAAVSATGIRAILIGFSDSVTTGDTITLPDTPPTGAQVSGNNYNKRINFTEGTPTSDVQSYLRGIGFSVAGATQTVSVTVTTEDITTDTFYNSNTQHYYQFINYASDATRTWTAAYNDAKAMTFMGRTGYLATVTSLSEDQLLYELSGGETGWMGGTILANTGGRVNASGTSDDGGLYYGGFDTGSFVATGWYWACGPEIGTTFYNVNSLNNYTSQQVTDADAANTGSYYNWSRTYDAYEPNNTDGNENCLTTLYIRNRRGKQGTLFAWNDIPSGNMDQSSDYAAKGYFVEYGNLPTGDSGSAGTAYATASGTLNHAYSVTANVRLDGSLSDVPLGEGAVELRQSGSTVYTMSGGSGVYTALAVNGAYDVYINGADTGTDVVVCGLASSADINYYTITFTAEHGGTASDGSISAAYDGSPLSNDSSIVPGGKTLVITAAGSGADYYSYAWSGTGFGSENASELTITALNRTVNALCTVTGRTAAPTYSVLLNTYGGTIDGGNVTSYTCGVGASLPANVTKDGYTFQGWYAETDFSGGPVTSIVASDTGDKVFHARWAADDTHIVGGTVGNVNGVISGASVTIRGSGITPQNTTTDASGEYSFAGIPAGEYNIVESYNGVERTVSVTVEDGDVSNADITMPTGRENSILTVAADTPDVVVGYLDQQFTIYDDIAASAGNSVVIRLTVEEQDENTASGAEEIQAASGQTVGMYLDLSLSKTTSSTDASTTETLTSSEELLKIIIPYDLTGKTNVVVYRYHSGTAEAMTEAAYSSATPPDECYMVSTAGNQVIVWTRSFSTYAISCLNTYAVSYNGNGATSGSVPASGAVADGTAWSSPGNPGCISKAGYTFEGWALTSDAASAVSTCTITGNTVFYAVWSLNSSDNGSTARRYTITAAAGNGGSISPGGSASVTSGWSKTFTITADEGYTISDVLVDGESVGAVGSYTFSNVTAAHIISAVFEKVRKASENLPFYYNGSGDRVFIGFAAETDGAMRYIAPDGATVLFQENTKTFTDTGSNWAKNYIEFVTEREIFLGTGSNAFSPDSGMTRAMFAAVVGRLYEGSYGKIEAVSPHAFTDCDYDDYYGKYVDWAAENGILGGYGNGKFGPGDPVTREQMAAILYRFADFLGVLPKDMDTELTYPDAEGISSYAKNAALYCQGIGIITGRKDGKFVPQGTATRAEVATIIQRFIESVLAQSPNK